MSALGYKLVYQKNNGARNEYKIFDSIKKYPSLALKIGNTQGYIPMRTYTDGDSLVYHCSKDGKLYEIYDSYDTMWNGWIDVGRSWSDSDSLGEGCMGWNSGYDMQHRICKMPADGVAVFYSFTSGYTDGPRAGEDAPHGAYSVWKVIKNVGNQGENEHRLIDYASPNWSDPPTVYAGTPTNCKWSAAYYPRVGYVILVDDPDIGLKDGRVYSEDCDEARQILNGWIEQVVKSDAELYGIEVKKGEVYLNLPNRGGVNCYLLV